MRNLFNSLGMVWQELRAHKTRLILTVLALAWGTFSISTLLALGQGLRMNMQRGLRAGGATLIMVFGGESSQNYAGQSQVRVPLTKQDLSNLRRGIPNLQRAIGLYKFQGPGDNLQANGNRPGRHAITGAGPNYKLYHHFPLTPGSRFINSNDQTNRRRVVVIGNKIASNLFPQNRNPVGKTISLMGLPFRVIGVKTDSSDGENIGEIDMSYQVILPDTTFEAIEGPNSYNMLLMQPKDNYNPVRMQNNIQKIIAAGHGLNPTDSSIVHVFDGRVLLKKVDTFMLGLQTFLGLVGSLTLIVAGIGIANVVYISVMGSIPSIGMRMALGARPWHITQHYLLEALLVTAIGGAIGLGASLIVCWVISAAHLTGFGWIPIEPEFSLSISMIILLVLGGIGFLSGFFPARKAAHVDPVVALRND